MSTAKRIIGCAIVGLGHIAQVAVLPAFAHARRNSRLTAVVSGDRTKRREIAKRYRLDRAFNYGEFEECLRSDDDANGRAPPVARCDYCQKIHSHADERSATACRKFDLQGRRSCPSPVKAIERDVYLPAPSGWNKIHRRACAALRRSSGPPRPARGGANRRRHCSRCHPTARTAQLPRTWPPSTSSFTMVAR